MDTLLKRIRDKKGDSTYAVADKIGINQGTYSQIERGLRTIDLATAKKIAEYCGLSLERVVFVAYCRYKVVDGVSPSKRKNKKKIAV